LQATRHDSAGTGLLTTAEMTVLEEAWDEAQIGVDALFTRMFSGLRLWPDTGLTGLADLVREAADTAAPMPGERHPLLVLLDLLGVAVPDGSQLRAISTLVARRLGVEDGTVPQPAIGRAAAIEIVIWPSGSD